MGNGHIAFRHQVIKEEDGRKVRQILSNRFRFSRRMFRRLRNENGMVKVNGENVFLTSRIMAGDVIEVAMPTDEGEGEGTPPQPIPLDVKYEDDDLIILNKPPGIVVHPTRRHPEGTLANGLAYHWQERGEFHLIRPVTRLDRDTSGLILFAKHAYGHAFLAKQMEKRRYQREYLAFVHGRVEQEKGILDGPIRRVEEGSIIRKVSFDGVRAVTHFIRVRQWKNASLLRLSLETGRTHQIRVHLSHMGHPIIGDEMYGGSGEELGMNRQALHAGFLSLIHPLSEERFSLESSLPEDMATLQEKLDKE
ncbi:23S rRNA pseudouridine1911/1915/1917 synthase [Marininema mesophilum]|uniref:Pseudouridine synthase n=1 Tax=Marininema mesophilum TaxID=1048340 RepID=A0A1H2YYR5_9BACL|nr:RluA family pseudouridine synthase [Marininema mesophilum]SDX10256.1 23S rRNA pseudouridine1911/1915/1917 synthase [Marininema mesophilum]